MQNKNKAYTRETEVFITKLEGYVGGGVVVCERYEEDELLQQGLPVCKDENGLWHEFIAVNIATNVESGSAATETEYEVEKGGRFKVGDWITSTAANSEIVQIKAITRGVGSNPDIIEVENSLEVELTTDDVILYVYHEDAILDPQTDAVNIVRNKIDGLTGRAINVRASDNHSSDIIFRGSAKINMIDVTSAVKGQMIRDLKLMRFV